MGSMDFAQREQCDNPDCTRTDRSNTYSGPNGNRLQVCDKCYWNLITEAFTPVNWGTGGGIITESGEEYLEEQRESVDFGEPSNVEYESEE